MPMPASWLLLQNVSTLKTRQCIAYVLLSDYTISEGTASDNTDSHFSWQLVRKWIGTCVESHLRCNELGDLSWKPTRLLDLGKHSEELQVRLIISKEHFSKTNTKGDGYVNNLLERYMTLSHCWGSIDILRLLTRNLGGLCQSIDPESLPKTFRHAMRVTKDLGVRYLWIDSLCIVQDSSADWLREAAAMSHVYKNSYCNIAATGAADGREGCFFARNPNSVSATKVHPDWEDASSETYVVLQPLPHHQSAFLHSPLLSRAWVLQERLLASRTLHFTKEQVFWECRSNMACEMFPEGIETAPACGGHHASIGFDDIHIHRRQDSEEETNRGLSKAAIEWNRIVDMYTMCDLTKESDKLIAISGIASEFHRTWLKPEDKYLAGLWKSQLPNALLWSAAGPSHRGDTSKWSRPKQYRAPSWSWASIEGPVSLRATEQHPGHWYHIFTEVVAAETTTVGDNPTGQVTGGYLHLLVLFAVATWQERNDEMVLVEIAEPGGKLLDIRQYSSTCLVGRMNFDVETTYEEVMTTPIVCMEYNAPIEGTRYTHGLAPTIYGFVLEDTGQGSFRRLGRWTASSYGTMSTSRVPELLRYFSTKIICLV